MAVKTDNRLYLVSTALRAGKKTAIVHGLLLAPTASRAATAITKAARTEYSPDDWQFAGSQFTRLRVRDLNDLLAKMGLRVVERR